MATIAHGTGTVSAPAPRTVAGTIATTRETATRYVTAALRFSLGWVFLWAFLDKLFGLGHETRSAAAWVNGGNPTRGFLSHAKGPFASFYQSFAGDAWANWLFMIGLAALGVALIAGIGMRIAAVAGGVLLLMMWSAVLPPANNVVMDDHLIYIGVLAVLALTSAGDTLGFGTRWARIPFVARNPWLK
jgi:thiosulfate dehydrogenase [quinone] large subunit